MVSYLNAMPVYDAILRHDIQIPAELEWGTPVELNQKIAQGQLDLSIISSFEYAKNPERYYLLPDLSISSEGAVGSILLFSKQPWGQIQGDIYLTSHSHTSIHLAQYLLRAQSVTYHFVERPSDEQLEGELLIGDEALLAQKKAQNPNFSNIFPYVYDLGQYWQEETGLAFVFAVWVVRRAVFDEIPELVWEITNKLLRSKEISSPEYERIAKEHYSELFETTEEALNYLEALKFHFSEDLKKGLLRFQKVCMTMGFLDRIAPLHFISPL